MKILWSALLHRATIIICTNVHVQWCQKEILYDEGLNPGVLSTSTINQCTTDQPGPVSEYPRRCSWNHHSRQRGGGRSWRTQQTWCRRWCCRESTCQSAGQHECQTAGKLHRPTRSQMQIHSERTARSITRTIMISTSTSLLTIDCILVALSQVNPGFLPPLILDKNLWR